MYRPKKSKIERVVINDSQNDERTKPDHTKTCEVCGASPIVPITGMCGPCTFGESETAVGNW